MANPNIVDVTNILGKTALLSITTDFTPLVANSAASGKVLKINSLIISNIDGTNSADVTVDIFRDSTSYKLASTITVPADATLVVVSKDIAIYLEEGDSIRCLASANGDLQSVCSYEEIS
jgi:hypothetical protein